MGYKRAKKASARITRCPSLELGRKKTGEHRVDDVGFKLGTPTLHARWPLSMMLCLWRPVGLVGFWWVLICLAPGGLNSEHIPSQLPVHQRAPTSMSIHKDGRLLNLFGPEMHSVMLTRCGSHMSLRRLLGLDSLTWPLLVLLGHIAGRSRKTVGQRGPPVSIPSFLSSVHHVGHVFF